MPSEFSERTSDAERVARRRVLVIGGAAGMGRWIVERVLRYEPSLRITLADTNPAVVEVARDLSLDSGEGSIFAKRVAYPSAKQVEGLDDAAQFDVVVLAVHEDQIGAVADAILPRLRHGAFVFDLASFKETPVAKMLRASPPGVSVLGTHPLFGPRVGSLAGQTIVLCDTDRTNMDDKAWLASLISGHGGHVADLTPKDHDALMAVVQTLPHFVLLAVGETFRRAGLDLRTALDCPTPPFRSLTALLGRMVDLQSQSQPKLYASIQMRSPHSAVLRRHFMDAARHLDDTFAKADESGAQDVIEQIAHYFAPSAIAECAAHSDETVRAHEDVDNVLHARQSDGSLCGLQYPDGRVKVGRVVEISRTMVVLESATVRDPRTDLLAVIYDEESAAAARLIGLYRAPRRIPYSRTSARLMSGGEVLRWRLENLRHHVNDLTVSLPPAIDTVALAEYLSALVPSLVSCELKDIYRPVSVQKNQVTYTTVVIGDRVPGGALRHISDVVKSLGGLAPPASSFRNESQSP